MRPGGLLHALRYLPNIRSLLWYFVIHIRNSLFMCDISLFIFGICNSLFICVIRSFFRIALFCAVTNNESNAITCSVRNRKIDLKRMQLWR